LQVAYYGYRFYDPVTGRWPSRDPIGELDSFNVYGILANNATNRTDILGLMDAEGEELEGKGIPRPIELQLLKEVGEEGEYCEEKWQCFCPGSLKIKLKDGGEINLRKWAEETLGKTLKGGKLWTPEQFEGFVNRQIEDLKKGREDREVGHGESITYGSALFKAKNDLRDKLWAGSVQKNPKSLGGDHGGFHDWALKGFVDIEINLLEDRCKCFKTPDIPKDFKLEDLFEDPKKPAQPKKPKHPNDGLI
jgi:hypothetical protein